MADQEDPEHGMSSLVTLAGKSGGSVPPDVIGQPNGEVGDSQGMGVSC